MRVVYAFFTVTVIGIAAFAAADASKPSANQADAVIEGQPGFFPLHCWDGGEFRGGPLRQSATKALEGIRECNFSSLRIVADDLPSCEKAGLRAIVILPLPHDSEEITKLTDAEIDERLGRVVQRTASSKAVLGYAIMDEPSAKHFPVLAKIVARLKKLAPGKLAFINLYPNYATLGAQDHSQLGTESYREYLERFVQEVNPQLLSYDNYAVEDSDDLYDEASAARYYDNLLEVRRVAIKHGLPFWNVAASNQIRKWTTIPSPANLAFQAYTTLAAGGRGLAWYTYYPRSYGYSPIDREGNRTDTWRYLRDVNRQVMTLGPIMNGLRSTGVFFSAPPTKAAQPLPGSLVKDVDARASVHREAAARPSVMIGEFCDEHGLEYVMIVNLSLQKSANVRFDTQKAYRSMAVYSAENGKWRPMDRENGHWLVAGHGALIRLEP